LNIVFMKVHFIKEAKTIMIQTVYNRKMVFYCGQYVYNLFGLYKNKFHRKVRNYEEPIILQQENSK